MPRSRAAPADVLDYDAELQLHHKFLHSAYGIHRSDHVLDVGCGVGSTTREAGRLASSGSALGIDISAHLVKRARSEAEAEGLRNVRFEQGNAEVYPLGREEFDVAISRFGTMFFADPNAAFVNIGQSLLANGRLVMLVWQAYDRNEWAVSIDQTLDEVLPPAPPSSENADPFSLGDPSVVERILVASGFEAVALTDVHAPVFYGPDVDGALAHISRFAAVHQRLADVAVEAGQQARRWLRSLLAAHDTGHGVWFDARSWLVTARRGAASARHGRSAMGSPAARRSVSVRTVV